MTSASTISDAKWFEAFALNARLHCTGVEGSSCLGTDVVLMTIPRPRVVYPTAFKSALLHNVVDAQAATDDNSRVDAFRLSSRTPVDPMPPPRVLHGYLSLHWIYNCFGVQHCL